MLMSELPFDMDIAVQFDGWADSLSDIEGIARQAIVQILTLLDGPKLGELSIALVNDAAIQVLNRDYRHKDKPTNVLSFPDNGPAPLLGDIVLSAAEMEGLEIAALAALNIDNPYEIHD